MVTGACVYVAWVRRGSWYQCGVSVKQDDRDGDTLTTRVLDSPPPTPCTSHGRSARSLSCMYRGPPVLAGVVRRGAAVRWVSGVMNDGGSLTTGRPHHVHGIGAVPSYVAWALSPLGCCPVGAVVPGLQTGC
jgi:hypothetical protein